MKDQKDELKEKVKELRDQGLSFREIAKSLGRSVSYVHGLYKASETHSEEGKPPKQSEANKQDLALATLNPGGRPLLEKVIGNLAWWQEAVQRIGFETVLTVFAYRRIADPEAELQKFRTADDFVRWVREYLGALFQAQDCADKLMELDKKYKAQFTANAILEIEIDKLKEQLDKTATILNYALQYVPKDVLQRLLMVQTLLNLPEQMSQGK